MKLIKLTNATKGRIGESLILNTEAMMSFFENTQEDGTKVTVAFGMNGNSWEVQETIDEIMSAIDG
ncbi:hypothetical protein UFOVP953_12 [uncultured Caudovirales phage]|uniref:Uncharacterized protein n=1 Tax=uncultured Caudovirales phage TaxID=2100421 RepID=A0A6J5PNW3_9CAUD|nr:hypothetical protein UFOVP953_12 [uncultured Caudovirales phage]